jgi:hypothetical protein
MDQLNNLADVRLIDGCVFCRSGLARLTRDHAPSRVLLDEPYPDNLPVVDACLECNNSFSLDEEYVACLVECAAVGSTNPDDMSRDIVRRILNHKPALRARIEESRRNDGGIAHFVAETTRVDNVVAKLARAHAAFELSTPLRDNPTRLAWWLLPLMDSEAREQYDAAHVHHLIGEVGSRATQRITVVQAQLVSAETGELLTMPLLMSDWVDVQEGRYRYLAVDDVGGSTVKIVIGEYLACEVTWAWEDGGQDSSGNPDARPTHRRDSQQLELDLAVRNREPDR